MLVKIIDYIPNCLFATPVSMDLFSVSFMNAVTGIEMEYFGI